MLGAIERHYEFGPFRLDAIERVVLCDGSPIPLTPKAFETLLTLVKHHGRVLSKDDLIRWIWPDTIVEEATLSQNIFTVRNAHGRGSSAAVIETVQKIGYRFVAAVQTVKEWRPVPIAVLPFKPIHSEQRDESLELGLADAVITRLSTASRVLVRPMSAIRRFGDLRQDSMSAARELEVDLVFEGSVHHVDQSVRADCAPVGCGQRAGNLGRRVQRACARPLCGARYDLQPDHSRAPSGTGHDSRRPTDRPDSRAHT